MNTNKLYQTSFGRFVLLNRLYLQNFKSSILWMYLSVFLSFLILPRLSHIFAFDLEAMRYSSIADWDAFRRLIPVCFLFSIMIPYYFNKVVRHSQPIKFGILPAKALEKNWALLSFSALVFVGACVVSYLTLCVDALLMPDLVTIGVSKVRVEQLSHLFSSLDFILSSATFLLLILSSLIYNVLTSMRFKNFWGGFLLGCGTWCATLIFISTAIISSIVDKELFPTQEESRIYLLIVAGLLFLLDLGLAYLVYRRLKNVED